LPLRFGKPYPGALLGCYIARMPETGSNSIDRFHGQRVWFAILVLLVVFWSVLWMLGREFITDSGFGVWTGAWSEDTSQWIADPYTFSHVLHGIFFYWMLLPMRRLGLGSRFIVASAVEAGWEILENTPFIIDRYRAATASLNYYGDSILNSTFDLVAAMLGFWIAWQLKWKWALALVVAIEVLLAYFVRDNLTLNILMLFYPVESIKQWQLGG
jgi:uncharacterized protein DUF2585